MFEVRLNWLASLSDNSWNSKLPDKLVWLLDAGWLEEGLRLASDQLPLVFVVIEALLQDEQCQQSQIYWLWRDRFLGEGLTHTCIFNRVASDAQRENWSFCAIPWAIRWLALDHSFKAWPWCRSLLVRNRSSHLNRSGRRGRGSSYSLFDFFCELLDRLIEWIRSLGLSSASFSWQFKTVLTQCSVYLVFFFI